MTDQLVRIPERDQKLILHVIRYFKEGMTSAQLMEHLVRCYGWKPTRVAETVWFLLNSGKLKFGLRPTQLRIVEGEIPYTPDF